MKKKAFMLLLVVLLLACQTASVSAQEFSDGQGSYYEIEYTVGSEPFDAGKSLLICYGTGLLIALITVGIMYGQLKSVRKQHAAGQYTKPGSMQLTSATDMYLYRNVTKIPIQQNNSKSR